MKPWTLQRVVTTQSEEMSQASRINDEMKASWNQLSNVNAMLRAQLTSVEAKSTLEQQDSSMQSPDDENLRGELTASLARESVWKNECYTTKIEVHQHVRERQMPKDRYQPISLAR